MPGITVLTPTLPERHDMLAEAVRSVGNQTLGPEVHLIGVDHARAGIVPVVNKLARSATTDWVSRLDDDDLIDPQHFELLSSESDNADVIYSWCRVEQRAGVDVVEVSQGG